MKRLGLLLLFPLYSGIYIQAQHALPQTAEPGGLFAFGSGIDHPEQINLIDLPVRTGQIILPHLKTAVKNGRIHGQWKSFHGSGQLLDEGALKKGIPDGVWKVWDSSGKLRAIRTYDAEKLERVKQEWRTNHPRQVLSALATLYRTNPEAALNFISVANSFSSASNMDLVVGLEKLAIINSEDMNKYRPPFNRCFHHGLFMNLSSEGMVLDSGYYKNGLPNGFWEHRSPASGSLWKGAYRNGLRQQEWKKYSPDGKLELIIFYSKNGLELWRKTLHK